MARLVLVAVLALAGCHCHAFTSPVAPVVVVRERIPMLVVERSERVERPPVRIVYKASRKHGKHAKRVAWSEVGTRKASPKAWGEHSRQKAFPIERRVSPRGTR